MTSGIPPIEIYRNPATYGLQHFGVPVEQATLDALRANLEYSRHEALQWVPDDSDLLATQVYNHLKCPKLDPLRGWEIFSHMAQLLEPEYEADV